MSPCRIPPLPPSPHKQKYQCTYTLHTATQITQIQQIHQHTLHRPKTGNHENYTDHNTATDCNTSTQTDCTYPDTHTHIPRHTHIHAHNTTHTYTHTHTHAKHTYAKHTYTHTNIDAQTHTPFRCPRLVDEPTRQECGRDVLVSLPQTAGSPLVIWASYGHKETCLWDVQNDHQKQRQNSKRGNILDQLSVQTELTSARIAALWTSFNNESKSTPKNTGFKTHTHCLMTNFCALINIVYFDVGCFKLEYELCMPRAHLLLLFIAFI